MRRVSFILPLAILLGMLLIAFSSLPIGIARSLIPTASAHALPVRSDPSSDAILQGPPSQVRMWFSEDLNPYTSHIIVVDPANREVDNKDSHVNDDNTREMIVNLPLLPAGTYIVTWRTQSADDGHVTGGSYIFRIARPDGSIPPLPSVLPTGNTPGAGGSGMQASDTLDGPTIFQAISTWLALLFMTFWVGGLIWQTWVLPPASGAGSRHPDMAAASHASTGRFSRLAPIALMLILVADIGIVLGQSAMLAGTWTGVFSPPLLHAILFGSRFGIFWWLRQGATIAALILTLAASRYGWALYRDSSPTPSGTPDTPPTAATLPDWRRETLNVFRDVRSLPARLVWGVRQRTLRGQLELLLGVALLIAFAFSGHASAVPSSTFAYAVGVDILHLLCESAWIGGLLYISVILLPTLRGRTPEQQARVLALGLPEFSAVAIVAALILAVTGSLSTTIHLTSISQFLTTTYGRTLAIKIEIFIVMVAISAYHAFFLRPRLAYTLTEKETAREAAQPQQKTAHARIAAIEAVGSGRIASADASLPASPSAATGQIVTPSRHAHALALADQIASWLRREAALGVAILACVALLGAFAGSLTPAASGMPATSPSSGAFIQTQQANGYAVTLKVAPAQFGPNTFTVTVKDSSGQPVKNVSVLIETVMLDMDMGTQALQLKAMGDSAPGSYSGQADLAMAGHWLVTVKLIAPNVKQPVTSDFRFSIAYQSS